MIADYSHIHVCSPECSTTTLGHDTDADKPHLLLHELMNRMDGATQVCCMTCLHAGVCGGLQTGSGVLPAFQQHASNRGSSVCLYATLPGCRGLEQCIQGAQLPHAHLCQWAASNVRHLGHVLDAWHAGVLRQQLYKLPMLSRSMSICFFSSVQAVDQASSAVFTNLV